MITLDERTARRDQSIDQEIIGLLDRLCKDLEITPAMFALAKERYESIAAYLNEPDSQLLKFKPVIYPQGSINLGTTVKPIGSDEFDVDVISQLDVSERTPTTAFKKLIFERLEKRGIYKLRMMNRCIRVQYANEFHIDITPAIPDHDQGPENILVTDKEAGCWKESNPKDYRTWFEEIAALQPTLLYEDRELMGKFAAAEPLPVPKFTRPLLHRIIQLMKRHRDTMFAGDKRAPISAIITTLAAQSYEHHAKSGGFSNQVQFIRAVVSAMPEFIVRTNGIGAVPNPANPLENYADKWAAKPERQKAFYAWHERVVAHFDKILDSLDRGKDILFEELSNAYGKERVKKAVLEDAEQRKILFEQHKLGVTKRSGFTAPIEKAAKIGASVMSVPKHTNFGE
jgi:SMODS domain-containing protein